MSETIWEFGFHKHEKIKCLPRYWEDMSYEEKQYVVVNNLNVEHKPTRFRK